MNIPDFRSPLIGKLLLVFGLAALLTVVVAAVAWSSFNHVVRTQTTIVEEAIPMMAAIQDLSANIPRISALLEQLPGVDNAAQMAPIAGALSERMQDVHGALDRMERQHVDDARSALLRSTAGALEQNLRLQMAASEQRLALEKRRQEAIGRQRSVLQALLGTTETMVANASATTTTNIVNLYRMLQEGSRQEEMAAALDRMIEVDIDSMERMSEFQLVCVKLQNLLVRLEGEREARQIPGVRALFQEYPATLQRRVGDLHDPNLRKASLAHYRALAAATSDGEVFALHAQLLAQKEALQQLRSEGATLASRLNEQAVSLVAISGEAIDRADHQARSAVDRGFLGFLGVAILLLMSLIVTLWFVIRYHLLDRLSGMEKAVRALSTGNYEIDLPTTGNDPLAPLGRALIQVKENVQARERLEQRLLGYQEDLERQVVAHTTELTQSNQLLAHEVAEHALARQEAEEANKAKNLFLGSLSHELRTPLSGVRGAARLLRETGLSTRQREYVDMIAYANAALLEILEDMLSFSRIEAGKLQLQEEPFALRQTLKDMLSLQSLPAHEKGIALCGDIAADVPEFVVGDRGKLNQLLLNVIGNAIKFTDEGQVSVSVSAGERLAGGKLRVHFSVADTGIGIPAEKMKEVFKPFFQAEETARKRHGGAGLGLAICQRLVRAMGGEIAISSREGQGTRVGFHLDFPTLERLPSSPCEGEDEVIRKAEQGLNVLVVEDDEINRRVCCRYLELLGHGSVPVGDGSAAIAVLTEDAHEIDAILMDISLPGRSGLEVAEEIRRLADGRWQRIPIVIMSAHVSAGTASSVIEAGHAAFLSKPFSLKALGKTLAALSDATRAEPASATVPAPVDAELDLAFLAAEREALGEETLSELLLLYQAELAGLFAEVDAHFAAGEWPALAARVHRLCGAAGNLGMARVIRLARRVETLAGGVAPDADEMAALLLRLKTDCGDACAALQDWLGRPPPAGS